MTNYLKTVRKVDTHLPTKENMVIFQNAVKLAVISRKWQKHPNRKRKDHEIQLVTNLGPLWESGWPEKDVLVNTYVIHNIKTDKFPFFEFLQFYAECTLEVRQLLDPILTIINRLLEIFPKA